MFELRNVDTKLLREQREALLASIDELACPSQPVQDGMGEQIDLLDGLINMIDDMLDAIEFSRPPEMAEYPIRGGE